MSYIRSYFGIVHAQGKSAWMYMCNIIMRNFVPHEYWLVTHSLLLPDSFATPK